MQTDLAETSQGIDLTPAECVIFKAAETLQVVDYTGC